MLIQQKDNWLGHKMENISDPDLFALFEEITEFRRIGILVGGTLRALEREFSDNVSKTSYGECMRLVEDAVLYEMARRFHNALEQKGEWLEYTGADAGFHYCSRCKRSAFNYDDGGSVVEILSDFCPYCGLPMKKDN